MSKITVDPEEVEELFDLLEKLNNFFHQSMNFDSQEKVEAFATQIYPEISKAYYETVWEWLPQEVKQEIEGSSN